MPGPWQYETVRVETMIGHSLDDGIVSIFLPVLCVCEYVCVCVCVCVNVRPGSIALPGRGLVDICWFFLIKGIDELDDDADDNQSREASTCPTIKSLAMGESATGRRVPFLFRSCSAPVPLLFCSC